MTTENLRKELEQLLMAKDTDSLKNLAQKAIEQYPNEALGYYYAGEALAQGWYYAEAAASFQEAIERDTEKPLYLRRYAFMLLKTGNELGKGMYEKLIQQYPEEGILYLELGEYCADAWLGAEAIPLLEKAVALLPNRWEAPFYLGRIIFNTELRAEEALVLINKAVELNPFTDTLELRIGINKYLKNYEACEADYLKLLELNGGEAHGWVNFANFYTEIENFEKADSIYTKAIEMELQSGYSFGATYQSRGEARLKSGNGSGAVEDFTKALELMHLHNPDSAPDARCLELRAQAKEALADEEGAIADLLLALESKPFQTWEIEKRLGHLYGETGQWAKAEAHLKKMGENDSWALNQSLLELGKLQQKQGNIQTAYNYWLQAKEAGVYEAEELITTHCQSILEAEKSKQDEKVALEFEGDAKRNSRSAFMGQLFGKYWQLDAQRSVQHNLEHNPMAIMIPDELRGVLLSILDDVRPLIESVYFEFTDAMLEINSSLREGLKSQQDLGSGLGRFNINIDPSKINGLKAYYKITAESPLSITLHAHRTGGKGNDSDIRVLKIHSEGSDVIHIEGLAGDRPLLLFFVAKKTAEELPVMSHEELKTMIDHLKQRAQEFIMTMMGAMAQGFGNVMNNMNAPTDDDDDEDGDGGQA